MMKPSSPSPATKLAYPENCSAWMKTDLTILHYFQSLKFFEIPSHFLHHIITDEMFALVMPLIFWTSKPYPAMSVLLIGPLLELSNAFLKWSFQLPRPFWITAPLRNAGKVWEQDYSFPSSHAQVAAGLITAIILYFPDLSSLTQGMLISVAVLTGFSRVYRGVHFPTCVATGWTLGVGSAFLMKYLDPINWFQTLGMEEKLKVAIAAFIAPYSILAFLRVVFPPIPQLLVDNWTKMAILNTKNDKITAESLLQPRRLAKYHMQIGSVFGSIIGNFFSELDLINNKLFFLVEDCRSEHVHIQIYRVMIGIAGIILIVYPLAFHIPPLIKQKSMIAGNIVQIIGFMSLGMWITYGCPKTALYLFDLQCPTN